MIQSIQIVSVLVIGVLNGGKQCVGNFRFQLTCLLCVQHDSNQGILFKFVQIINSRIGVLAVLVLDGNAEEKVLGLDDEGSLVDSRVLCIGALAGGVTSGAGIVNADSIRAADGDLAVLYVQIIDLGTHRGVAVALLKTVDQLAISQLVCLDYRPGREETACIVVVIACYADHALACARHLIVNVGGVVHIGANVRAAVGDFKGAQVLKTAVGRIGIERPGGMIVGNKEAVFACCLDDLVEALDGEDTLIIRLTDPLELIEIVAGVAPDTLGVIADHLGVVGIFGIEIQVNLLVVIEGGHFALVEAEGRVVGIAKGIFVRGDGDKFIVRKIRKIKQALVLGERHSGITVRLICFLDLLGRLFTVGQIGVTVHIYFVKLAALRQKILFHVEKPPCGIFYIIAIVSSIVNSFCFAGFVRNDSFFVEDCADSALEKTMPI